MGPPSRRAFRFSLRLSTRGNNAHKRHVDFLAVGSARSRSSEANLVRAVVPFQIAHLWVPCLLYDDPPFSLSSPFPPPPPLSLFLPLSPEAARSEARRWSDKGARHVHPSCTGRLFIPEVKSVAAEAVWTSRRTKSTNFGHRLLARCARVAAAPRHAARSMMGEIRRPRPTSINFHESNQIGLLRR